MLDSSKPLKKETHNLSHVFSFVGYLRLWFGHWWTLHHYSFLLVLVLIWGFGSGIGEFVHHYSFILVLLVIWGCGHWCTLLGPADSFVLSFQIIYTIFCAHTHFTHSLLTHTQTLFQNPNNVYNLTCTHAQTHTTANSNTCTHNSTKQSLYTQTDSNEWTNRI